MEGFILPTSESKIWFQQIDDDLNECWWLASRLLCIMSYLSDNVSKHGGGAELKETLLESCEELSHTINACEAWLARLEDELIEAATEAVEVNGKYHPTAHRAVLFEVCSAIFEARCYVRRNDPNHVHHEELKPRVSGTELPYFNFDGFDPDLLLAGIRYAINHGYWISEKHQQRLSALVEREYLIAARNRRRAGVERVVFTDRSEENRGPGRPPERDEAVAYAEVQLKAEPGIPLPEILRRWHALNPDDECTLSALRSAISYRRRKRSKY